MKQTIKLILCAVFVTSFISCASTNAKKTNPTGLKVQTRTEVVSVTGGDLRGILNKEGNVEIFAGIPFAAPPVGDLRWKEPQDVIPWTGILEADHFAPMAMQNENGRFFQTLMNIYTGSKNDRTYKGPMSEDCLYLNVWRPVGKAPQGGWPVLVYVHGGTLLTGQSWYEKYDGENLAANGIVVVNITYRVGVFGYFADEELVTESPHGTTGNYGLLDQIKALEWVHNNIAAFFRRAIGESSSVIQQTPPHTFRTMEAALKMGNDIKKEFGCKNIEELRALPASKLIKTKYKNSSMTVDGYALPATPYEIYQKGQNHEEALLNGFNAREGFGFAFFTKVNKKNIAQLLEPSFKNKTADFLEKYGKSSNKELKELYNDVFTAVCFSYPHEVWTRTVEAQGKPVYEYFFSRENGEIGTNHSGELIYAYRNVPRTKNYKARDYELEEIMSSYWLNFVKYGNPNGKDTKGNELPLWQTTSESGGLLMDFGDTCNMIADPFSYIYNYLQ